MKLAWREFKVFRIRVTLPAVIVITQKLDAEQIERFRKYRAEMAECPKCHKFYNGYYHRSLIMHLADDHAFDSLSAISIVEDLGNKTLAKRREMASAISSSN